MFMLAENEAVRVRIQSALTMERFQEALSEYEKVRDGRILIRVS
jgi:hypothetical protein